MKKNSVKAIKSINGVKLNQLLKKNAVNASQLAIDAGFSKGYINAACKDGRLSTVVINFLELKGIHYEDYAPDPEPEVKEEPVIEQIKPDVKTVKDLTPDELSNLIYKAVYSAVACAWKDM